MTSTTPRAVSNGEPADARNPLRVVATSRGALYLLGTSLIGRLPTAMAALAIVQLVRLQGGGYTLAGTMTAVYIVAGAIGQPALSRWIDRSSQTLVLLVAAVVSTASFAAIAVFSTSAPIIGALGAALAGFFGPPLEPSLRSLWPRIVPEGRPLKAAFSLDAGAQELIFILGPLLTVVGIAAFGETGNVLFAAALGLVGTVAFALNRTSRQSSDGERAAGPRASPMRTGRIRRLTALTLGVGLPVGVLTIAATVAEETYALDGFAGWALAINAVGALVGATVIAMRPPARSPLVLAAPAAVLLAVGYIPLAFIVAPPLVWLAFAFLAGLMLPPTLSQVFEAVGTVAEPTALTEANAWVVSGMSIGVAAGTLAAGAVASAGSPFTVPVSVAGAIIVTTLLAFLARPAKLAAPAD